MKGNSKTYFGDRVASGRRVGERAAGGRAGGDHTELSFLPRKLFAGKPVFSTTGTEPEQGQNRTGNRRSGTDDSEPEGTESYLQKHQTLW